MSAASLPTDRGRLGSTPRRSDAPYRWLSDLASWASDKANAASSPGPAPRPTPSPEIQSPDQIQLALGVSQPYLDLLGVNPAQIRSSIPQTPTQAHTLLEKISSATHEPTLDPDQAHQMGSWIMSLVYSINETLALETRMTEPLISVHRLVPPSSPLPFTLNTVFGLCYELLDEEATSRQSAPRAEPLPLSIRLCAAELLIAVVKLNDARHDLKRAGKEPNDLPNTISVGTFQRDYSTLFTSADRRVFYVLVISLSQGLGLDPAASSFWKSTGNGSLSTSSSQGLMSSVNVDPVPLDVIRSVQVKALQVLCKDGKDVRAFPDLVPTLHQYLTEAWTILFATRRAPPSPSLNDFKVEGIQVQEQTFASILQLIAATLKFNFAKVPPRAVSDVLETVCKISDPTADPDHCPYRDSEPAIPPPTLPLPPSSTILPRSSHPTPPTTPAQTALQGERLQSPASSAATRLPPNVVTSPTSRPSDRKSGSSLPGMQGTVGMAPINLTLVSPAKSTPARVPDAPVSLAPSPAPHPLILLRVEEVKLMFSVVEATITFGFLPPETIAPVTFFVARIFGRDQLGALADPSLNTRATGVQVRMLSAHYANPSLRAVLTTLATLSTGRTCLAVGGLRYLAHAASYIDGLEASHRDRDRHDGRGVRPRYAAATPILDLPLLQPTLLHLAQAQSDGIDLELVQLYSRILPRLPRQISEAQDPLQQPEPTPPSASTSHVEQLKCIAPTTLTDWKLLLELLNQTRVRVEHLRRSYVQDTNPVSSTTAQARHASADMYKAGQTKSSTARTAPDPEHPVVAAFISLLSSCRFYLQYYALADTSSVHTLGENPERTLFSIPWAMGWSELVLSLLSAYPDGDAEQVVEFVGQFALALPCSSHWIETLNALIDGVLYRAEPVSKPLGSTPAPRARRLLAKLLFDHVYPSVADFPQYHSRLVVDVLLPLAYKILFDEPDPLVLLKLLDTLVFAAAAAGTAEEKIVSVELERVDASISSATGGIPPLDDTGLDDADSEPLHATNLDLFNMVRALLKKLVRDGRGVMGGAEAERSKSVFCLHSANQAATPVTVYAVLALIAVFNRIAFTSPWDPQSGSVDVGDSMAARTHAITLLKDINEVIRGPLDPALDGPPPPEVHKIAMEPRLVALQWALRLRTDNQHRLYLLPDIDDFIEPHALLIGRDRSVHITPDDPLPRTGRTPERGWEDTSRPNSTGMRDESRGRDRSRRGEGPMRSAREGSRVRVTLLEREREKDRDREREQARLHWHLPQRILFEHSDDMVRSEIVRTYIPPVLQPCREVFVEPDQGEEDALEHLSESSSIPLPVSLLLESYRLIMAQETDWDLVSYVICHLPSQLTNRYLFCGPRSEAGILALQTYLVDALPSSFARDVNLPPGLGVKKAAVAAIAYQTLQALVGYRGFLARSRQDEVVLTFVRGVSSVSSVSSNESVNLACVRGLALCAVQLTKSFTFALPQALTALQRVVTSGTMSVHILELMITIAHTPATYRDFRFSDYKLVLGIASQYISYHQSMQIKAPDPSVTALRQYVVFQAYYVLALFFTRIRVSDRIKYVELVMRELLDGKQTLTDQTKAVLDYLSRVTFANAHAVPERSFINSTLFGTGPARDPAFTSMVKPLPGQQTARKTKTYIYPHSIVSISALQRRQWCEVLIRRPSSIISLLVKVENGDSGAYGQQTPALRLPDHVGAESTIAPPRLPSAAVLPPHLEGPAKYGERPSSSSRPQLIRKLSLGNQRDHLGVENTSDASLIIPPFRTKMPDSPDPSLQPHQFDLSSARDNADPTVETQAQRGDEEAELDARIQGAADQLDPALLQLSMTGYPDGNESMVAVPLDTSAKLVPSWLGNLDRQPVMDSYKIGVLFVGPNQSTEREILGNVYGSAAYAHFVRELGGRLYPLDSPEVQARGTTGLSSHSHGRHMYIWRDEITQVFWHVATMMPNLPEDLNMVNKKGPIGNDHVHIIWNESGNEYHFGTIPSQFVEYMVNIVISPDARGGVELGSLPRESVSKSYRVTLQRSTCFPNFSPVGDGVIISEDELPRFVRVLAINSILMAQICFAVLRNDPFVTNWTSRLGMIQRLYQRAVATHPPSDEPYSALSRSLL